MVLFSVFLVSSAHCEPPEAAVEIAVKKVDATRFPEVDVYFTVIDNVPGSAYYDLEDPANSFDLTISESPAEQNDFTSVAGSLQDSQVLPLAATMAIDRSDSVLDTIDKIKDATRDWVANMDDSDCAALLFFAGGENCNKMYFKEATSDKAALDTFCVNYLGDTCGGTPMFTSWYLALGALEDLSEEDYPVRGIISLTDGGDTSGNNRLTDLTQVAMSLGLPFYNIAFPKLRINNGTASIGNDIVPSNLIPISEATHGCYFEPIPPYPDLPEMPSAPADTTSTQALDDTAVKDYSVSMIRTLELMVKNDEDAQSGQCFEVFKEFVNQAVTTDYEITNWQDLDTLITDTMTDAEIENMLDTDMISELDWETLNTAAGAVATAAVATVSEEDLNTFYNEQMANMFNKISESLKRRYRLTFTSPNTKLDGTLRDIKVQIAYTTHVNFSPVNLVGDCTARFVAPLVEEEDVVITQTSSMDPGSPIYNSLFGGGAAPRDGSWTSDTSIDWGVQLMARDETGTAWSLATMDPAGDITIAEDPDSPYYSVEGSDITTFLEHVQMNITVDGDELTQQMVAYIPTCIACDRENPQDDWPLPNESALEFRKSTLWYVVTPVASRNYQFTKKVPSLASGSVVVNSFVEERALKEEFPPLITYVYDSTAPTISLFLSPARGEINRIEALEIDMDSETRPRPMTVFLHGKQWDPSYSEDFDGFGATLGTNTLARTDWPLNLSTIFGDPATPSNGIYVYEGQRVELNVLCCDNYDRASDLSYMSDPATIPAPHNDYRDSDVLQSEGEFDDSLPYLKRIAASEIGSSSGYAAQLIDNGAETDLGSWHIFRTANYPDGVDRAIKVMASDEAGNVSSIEVPVYVMPLGFDAKRLEWQSKKNK